MLLTLVLRVLGIALVASALLALVLSASLWVLLSIPRGRALVAHFASERVSATIAGELRIGELERVDLPELWARDVALVAPDGTAAIDVKEAHVALDLAAIMRGTFAFERADVRGGVVRVLADESERTNMERTFATDSGGEDGNENEREHDALDLRRMATSDMTLIIEGKGLPSLHLKDLDGIMRVHVLGSGRTELRFDEYRGSIDEGLPTGALSFEDVSGYVQTERGRLLRFEGRGESEGEPVQFELDVRGSPAKSYIDATFPHVSTEAFSTRIIGLWAKLFHDSISLDVHLARSLAQGDE